MARTVAGAVTLRAVNKGDVVPYIAVGDAVLKLRVLASSESVGFADLQRGTAAVACAAEGLRIFCACRNVDRAGGVALVYAPEPDLIGAAIADYCVANGVCNTGLRCGDDEEDFA